MKVRAVVVVGRCPASFLTLPRVTLASLLLGVDERGREDALREEEGLGGCRETV